MKKYFSINPLDKETIRLAKDQIIAFKGRKVLIKCVSGSVWVTWPKGAEQTLLSGQSVSPANSAKVCILAFSDAVVQIQPQSVPWREILLHWMSRQLFQKRHGTGAALKNLPNEQQVPIEANH